jgi:hypothetical protein
MDPPARRRKALRDPVIFRIISRQAPDWTVSGDAVGVGRALLAQLVAGVSSSERILLERILLEELMKVSILFGLAVLVPVAAMAADEMRPLDAKVGLWESTVSTQMSGLPAMAAMPQIPESALAKMTPQQRAQMESMMKSRASGGAPQVTTKVCLTRESLSSGALARQDNSCTHKVISSSAAKQVVHVECVHGEVKTAGDLTVELVDPEHIKGTMAMKSAMGGQNTDMKMSFNNKWISADCGDVKPARFK